MNFWVNVLDNVKTATAPLVIGGSLIGIIVIVLVFILRSLKPEQKDKNQTLAIAASTIASCVLMVFVVTSFNHLVESRIEGGFLDETSAEIQAQRAKAAELIAANELKMLKREELETRVALQKQSIMMRSLDDNIKLLENAQLSMRSFEKIVQLALLQTNINQTMVRKEDITPLQRGLGINANSYNDEILVIITHDINAKYGVDLNEVKIAKLDGNDVAISGIRSSYIGSDINKNDEILKEVRRLNYKKNKLDELEIDSIRPNYDRQSLRIADSRVKQYEAEFQTSLSNGQELDFMNDAVVQLAKNFITVMLAPLQWKIIFTDTELPGALPIMQYMQKELEEKKGEKIKLQDINDNLLLESGQADETKISETEIISGYAVPESVIIEIDSTVTTAETKNIDNFPEKAISEVKYEQILNGGTLEFVNAAGAQINITINSGGSFKTQRINDGEKTTLTFDEDTVVRWSWVKADGESAPKSGQSSVEGGGTITVRAE
ncbi:MAG: hypothetical protein FWH35_00755 [Treponema sp.]|nr:hypothetical protein [Treponema sp.]